MSTATSRPMNTVTAMVHTDRSALATHNSTRRTKTVMKLSSSLTHDVRRRFLQLRNPWGHERNRAQRTCMDGFVDVLMVATYD